MYQPRQLSIGDKVAIVSLSRGLLGEKDCQHIIELGTKRLKEFGLTPVFMPNALMGITYLKEHPELRAKDLKEAFLNPEIKGIICAIGGDDTYRLLPYLLEDEEFINQVRNTPKLFTGFSDTTINHLMFYQIGLGTFYGPNFICDLGEMEDEMLPYTKEAFLTYIKGHENQTVTSSKIWYEERTDFSKAALGTKRISHAENKGYEVLQGSGVFTGKLLGGCLDSFYDILTTTRYADEKEVCARYSLFPSYEEWKGKILFTETCEEKPSPELLREELLALKQEGVFDAVRGVIVGKPQDKMYYEEYKEVWKEVIDNKDLPILYNVNFGHAIPRCVIPYGIEAEVDMEQKIITYKESLFNNN